MIVFAGIGLGFVLIYLAGVGTGLHIADQRTQNSDDANRIWLSPPDVPNGRAQHLLKNVSRSGSIIQFHRPNDAA